MSRTGNKVSTTSHRQGEEMWQHRRVKEIGFYGGDGQKEVGVLDNFFTSTLHDEQCMILFIVNINFFKTWIQITRSKKKKKERKKKEKGGVDG